MARKLVLIEEDSCRLHDGARQLLDREWGFRCEELRWGAFEPESLLRTRADLLVAIAVSRKREMAHFFQWLRENPVNIPSLAVLSGNGANAFFKETAEVADDFILTPVDPSELRQRVARILGPADQQFTSVHSELMLELGKLELVGRDPAFVHIVNMIPRIAGSDAFVLITGETGTGKELFARAIHSLSARHAFPFAPLDCGAIPDHLFENELFGHVPGAYTDARNKQKGLVEMAEGGTLFLDEVDSLPLPSQAKLLRLLQERTYKRLGEARFTEANVNIIAATNTDLRESVQARRFRSDLYYRLNVLQIHLHPLRDRRGDVELLALHCLESMGPSGAGNRVSPAALRKLDWHDWPGNIRELFNVVQRAALLAGGGLILPQHIILEAEHSESAAFFEPRTESFSAARARVIADFEKRYVEEILRQHHGNITHAARAANKERRAFGRLAKKHGINPAEW